MGEEDKGVTFIEGYVESLKESKDFDMIRKSNCRPKYDHKRQKHNTQFQDKTEQNVNTTKHNSVHFGNLAVHMSVSYLCSYL